MVEFEFLELGLNDEAAIRVFGLVLFVEVLVVALGRIEGGNLGDLGNDGVLEVLLVR